MPEQTSKRWQFSLAALMLFVAVAAVLCMLAGLIGYAVVLGIGPIVWLFWATYRLLDTMIKTDNRNSNLKRPTEPLREQ